MWACLFLVPAPKPPPAFFLLVNSFLESLCSQVSGWGKAPAPHSARRFSPMLESTSAPRHARSNAFRHAHGNKRILSPAHTSGGAPIRSAPCSITSATCSERHARHPKHYLPGKEFDFGDFALAKCQKKNTVVRTVMLTS